MSQNNNVLPLEFVATTDLAVPPEEAFQFLDDPKKLSSHMGKSSWMMAGSKMDMQLDQKGGRDVGSEIIMTGKMMGIPLFLREVISERVPGKKKVWKTIGPQKLIIIDQYQMGFELEPTQQGSKLRVFIQYSLPKGGLAKLIARSLSGVYARWCTEKMAKDAAKHFVTKSAKK